MFAGKAGAYLSEAPECSLYAREFVPRRPFRHSLMFVGQAGAYRGEAPECL
jgi:hypothetical protein